MMSDHRDNWYRMTLRLPPSVHQELVNNADGRSLNGTIIEFLRDGLGLSGRNPGSAIAVASKSEVIALAAELELALCAIKAQSEEITRLEAQFRFLRRKFKQTRMAEV